MMHEIKKAEFGLSPANDHMVDMASNALEVWLWLGTVLAGALACAGSCIVALAEDFGG